MGLLRHDAQSEFLAEFWDGRTPLHKPFGTVFYEIVVNSFTVNESAESVGAFKQRDGVLLFGESIGGCKSGYSAAYDGNVQAPSRT